MCKHLYRNVTFFFREIFLSIVAFALYSVDSVYIIVMCIIIFNI